MTDIDWELDRLCHALNRLFRGAYREAAALGDDALTPSDERRSVTNLDLAFNRTVAELREVLRCAEVEDVKLAPMYGPVILKPSSLSYLASMLSKLE